MAQCCKNAFWKNAAAQQALGDLLLIEDNSRTGTHDPSNHTAGNFGAGITGWLGGKIIGMVMDNNGSANHLINGKAVGQKCTQRKSIVPKQRRQVASVVRMSTATWIIVRHGIRERIIHIAAAVGSRVDVKSKNPPLARRITLGKAADFRTDDHALVDLVKPHDA